MADYDLSKAFERIERELIDSMMRNLDAHRAEETARGYNWEQWQALQLKALEKYRTTNRKKFTQPFNALNNEIAQMLRDSYNDGATEQEKKILQQVKKGYKGAGTNAGAQTGTAEVDGEFFKTNNRKLDALVQATTHDMNRAEHAVLRRANDQYRKIIFSAQVYANTGAGTYEKAVDMATRDFLRAGINGIQYRNGSQHSITEYARMAIKTASTRAYLQGEGDMRKEMGIPTVILNKRTNACPLCAPFVGKVFIDDVWSGGSSTGISPVTGAKYPLLSDAIAAGLYHPNCRDIHTTYFEGINTAPEGSTYTKEELQAMADTYKAEQEESYCERQAERCERLEEYSLDKENKAQYAARAVNWRRRSAKCSSKLKACKKRLAELSESTDESGISEAPAVKNSTVKSVEAVKNNPVETVEKSESVLDYMSNSFRPKFSESSPISFQRGSETQFIEVKKVSNSQFDMVTDVETTKRNKAVRLVEKNMVTVLDSLPSNFELPKIAVVDFEKNKINSSAIGGYDRKTGILYINSKYDTTQKILDFVNQTTGMYANNTQYAPVLHELGHKYYYDSIKSLAISKGIKYNKAKEIIDNKLSEHIRSRNFENNPLFLMKYLSGYAQKGYSNRKITEIVAESFSVRDTNEFADSLIKVLEEAIL